MSITEQVVESQEMVPIFPVALDGVVAPLSIRSMISDQEKREGKKSHLKARGAALGETEEIPNAEGGRCVALEALERLTQMNPPIDVSELGSEGVKAQYVMGSQVRDLRDWVPRPAEKVTSVPESLISKSLVCDPVQDEIIKRRCATLNEPRTTPCPWRK